MVVFAPAAPVKVTVTPAIGAPGKRNVSGAVIVPEIEKVPAAAVPTKFTPGTFAPAMVTGLLVGVKVKPACEGVTV